MQYRDLIQFQPVDTVVQLREAEREEAARQLVSTYIVSDAMAERLAELVIPNLQFTRPADNKGLLVVGNYGTGKSHLMAVLSAVAEHRELAAEISHPRVREATEGIAGRFQVIRTELGGTTIDFREFVCAELECALDGWGIPFRFPPRDRIANHKPAFEEMMAAFGERFPEQGLLFVVDELLDYLRGRRDQELVLDLGFLRELGEMSRFLRFRFMAGLQEMLFDSPRFAHVADSLRRVRDRFEQLRIAQSDLRFVVAERLLRKTADQQHRIREHLLPFARFYPDLSERMDDYVRLFPIHPEYIATFQRIGVEGEASSVEKREVLRTLSRAMRSLLDEPVPPEAPGLLAYDGYWSTLREDPSFRVVPEIRQTIEASEALEGRIERAFTRPAYLPLARRIVHGLSVHRLTTGDVHAPIGATPEELRDGLCLWDENVAELGGDPADDLLSLVETVLAEIGRTVSGQFISQNPDNRQWFLDLRKTEDFDALIEKRAESLDTEALDRAYWDALGGVVLERADQPPHASGFRVWERELPWLDRGTTRRGYLLFGSPSDRSTAIPPRDFYLFFLPWAEMTAGGTRETDEVVFRLMGADDDFRGELRRFAAARDLAATASGPRREVYTRKAEDARYRLGNWLRRNLASAYEVGSGGKTRPLQEWLRGTNTRQRLGLASNERAGARDLAMLAAAAALAPHWANQAPEYPRFRGVEVTEQNRARLAQQALRWIAGKREREGGVVGTGGAGAAGAAVLDALELLDGERIDPHRSRYAMHILDRLRQKGQGQVLNRDELIRAVDGIEWMAPERYRLEPEWAAVLLGALVHSGDGVLVIPGAKLDANRMDELAATPIEMLVDFRHLEPPREWNLPGLKALFEVADLEPGLANDLTLGREEPVRKLLPALGELVGRLARARREVQGGLAVWGRPLLTGPQQADRQQRLEAAQHFLEGLQAFSSPARFKNFRFAPEEVRGYAAAIELLRETEALGEMAAEIQPLAGYLSHAETVLPDGHPWTVRVRELQGEMMTRVAAPAAPGEPEQRQRLLRRLEELKREYVHAYSAMHSAARLSAAEDRRKEALLRDERLLRLRALAAIDLLHRAQLNDFQARLAALRSCFALTERELAASPVCPQCGFQPAREPAPEAAAERLHTLDEELDTLLANWTDALRSALGDPGAQQSLALLAPEARASIEEFLRTGELPELLDAEFIDAVQQALSGLEKVTVGVEELRSALLEGGSPATPEELRRRFGRLLDRLTRGKPAERVRVVVE